MESDRKQCKVMMIKYDIQHLSNAQGKGISRPYVQLSMQHLSPPAELEEMAERNTTLTRADMRAALSVVAEFVKAQLARGSRVHLPGLGYFALAASIDRPADEGQQPIKGSDIRVRTVKFKPEAALLELLRRNVGFRRSAPAQVSRKYTPAHRLSQGAPLHHLPDLSSRIPALLHPSLCVAEAALRQRSAAA